MLAVLFVAAVQSIAAAEPLDQAARIPAAAASAAVQCPAAPTTGHCPTATPKSSYSASNGILTAAQCCAQCAADKSLCFGWTWSAPGPDSGIALLEGGGSCAQFDAPLDTSNTAAWNCTYGINVKDTPKPLPTTPPKKPPASAKNVLFIVADVRAAGTS